MYISVIAVGIRACRYRTLLRGSALRAGPLDTGHGHHLDRFRRGGQPLSATRRRTDPAAVMTYTSPAESVPNATTCPALPT